MRRLKRLWGIINDKNIKIDSIFLPNAPDENFYYMTGLDGPFEGCFAMLGKNGAEVAVSELDYESAKKQGVKKLKLVTKRSEKIGIIKGYSGSGKIGVVADKLPYSSGKRLESMGLKLIDVSSSFEECRMIKDKNEVRLIKTAVNVSKKALRDSTSNLTNENALAAKIEGSMRSRGCGLAFPTICAADKNSALPHYATGSSKINKMVLVDFGARFKGYCADITRCVFKKRPDWFAKTESKVMKAYDKCVSIAENGGTGFEMQKAAQSTLGKGFIHSIGHFLGRDVHESSLSNFKTPFVPGMVFTIEPGFYDVKRGGVRFENDFLVTKNGVKEL
ncbi:MAG: aminopeptidase P family protein [Candidatus Aenigmarchaeota archaeon]|nr:aminopeptidase P family protein [Candidatus Aenigmarchaeota archaeon]